jgi:hypothetical protein
MQLVDLPARFFKFSNRSKQSQLIVTSVVSAMAVFLMGSIFVTKPSSAHGVNTHGVNSAKKKQQGCCSDQPAIPRRMIGTYYTTEDNFESTLVLNNKGPHQIMVTPILHSKNGRTFTASPVAVGGQSSSEVDLNLLASVAGQQFRSGSFEFTYEGRLLEVGGGLRIVNVEKSLIFDEQMLEPGLKFPSSQFEAVYAVPFEDSQVRVIVTNTTAQPIIVNGDAIFAGANGHHPIQSRLGPYETQVVNLPHGLVKKASAGAVSLNHDGGKGALLAMIHLQEADRGYSESVNFTGPGGKTAERHGAGLRLGRVNNDPLRPVIAVRNIGGGATTVTATVPYSKQNGDTGVITLPQVSLEPGEIKLLDASNPQLMRNDFATAGLEIKYSGAPGSVIASASSVSQSGNQVFAVPMKDPKIGLSSSGGYPWFIKETSSTVVFIKNVTDEPQQFMLNIIYPGDQWRSDIRILDAGQTFALDVRKLRDSQEKGMDGKVIPLGATSGHVSWSYRGKRDKPLIGRAQTVDMTNGLASTYECQCVCGWNYNSTRMAPQFVSAFEDDTWTLQPQVHYADCHGSDMGWANVYSGFDSRFSENPAVVDWDWIGDLTAVAVGPGSTWLGVTWEEYVGHPEPISDGYSECVTEPVEAMCEGATEVAQTPASVRVESVDVIADDTPGGCTSSSPFQPFGIMVKVRYVVLDRRAQPINRSDMRVQEKVLNWVFNGVNKGNIASDWVDVGPTEVSGTSQFTDASGKFTDAPVGSCSSGSFTDSKNQLFSILIGGRRWNVRNHTLSTSSSAQHKGTISNGSDVQKSR